MLYIYIYIYILSLSILHSDFLLSLVLLLYLFFSGKVDEFIKSVMTCFREKEPLFYYSILLLDYHSEVHHYYLFLCHATLIFFFLPENI